MLKNVNSSIKEPLIVYGMGIIITLFSVIFFETRGYPVVNTLTETLNFVTPPPYMIPIFLPYGILIGELIWMWIEKEEKSIYIVLLIESIIIAILALMRYIINIPFSGHAIILFFYIPHQLLNNNSRYPLRILIGILILAITIIYKIFLWKDPITFLLGVIVGIILWIPGFLFRLKKVKK